MKFRAISDVFYSSFDPHKVTVPAYTQAAVLIGFEGAGIMTVKTYHNIVERQCSIIARGVIHALPAKVGYV